MGIKGGIKAYLIAHSIVTGLLCILLGALFIVYYSMPHINSILHHVVAGDGEFYEYALLITLVLRLVHTAAFFKHHWSFRILFFVEVVLNIVVAATAEYPDGNLAIALLVLDAPFAVYLLFSKTVRQFAPFTLAKGWKASFENWMYNHMAMDKFPAENTDDYLQEFNNAQTNQYAQWKYPLAGMRTPLNEARGNALLYSLWWFFGGVVVLSVLAAAFISETYHFDLNGTAGLIVLSLIGLSSCFIGWRYVQLHYRRKYVAKMRGKEEQRKRKIYKGDKQG